MVANNENFIKLVHVGRKAKVVKGGRRFSFAAIVVAGNKNGMVGLGTGKATEVLEAHEKAKNEALRKMNKIFLKGGGTPHHDGIGKFGSSLVKIRSAPAGTGIIAASLIRAICEAAGIKDIVVKSFGSSNPHNMLKAAMNALTNVHPPKYISEKRGKSVGEIYARATKKVPNVKTESKSEPSE